MAVPGEQRPNAGRAVDRELCGRLALEVRRLLLSEVSSRAEITRAVDGLPGFRAYLQERVRGGRLKARADIGAPELEHLSPGSTEWILWRFGSRVVESCLLDFLRSRPWRS
jgi:hypothetical protein